MAPTLTRLSQSLKGESSEDLSHGSRSALTAAVALALSACAANEGGGAPGGSTESAAPSLSGTLTGIGASSVATAQETLGRRLPDREPRT